MAFYVKRLRQLEQLIVEAEARERELLADTARIVAGLESAREDEARRWKMAKKMLVGLDHRMDAVERILSARSEGGDLSTELLLMAQDRRRRSIAVREPLVLISQIQRSGGTLLSQLLDAHPQCHVHPYELRLGPHKTWPPVDLSADADSWWNSLQERHTVDHLRRGYQKQVADTRETLPFLFVPALARRLFDDFIATHPPQSRRDLLDAYMTAFFNAWLDNHSLYGSDKRWVVAFSPFLGLQRQSREGFFSDYPDGRLISIIREPKSWFVSARAFKAHAEKDYQLASAMHDWTTATRETLDARREHPERVLVVSFERLVMETRAEMERITSFLGIALLESALEPTFNGMPIKADSSFGANEHGILRMPARRASELEPELCEQIDEMAADLHDAAVAEACHAVAAGPTDA